MGICEATQDLQLSQGWPSYDLPGFMFRLMLRLLNTLKKMVELDM
jgi:hypothetical protein